MISRHGYAYSYFALVLLVLIIPLYLILLAQNTTVINNYNPHIEQGLLYTLVLSKAMAYAINNANIPEDDINNYIITGTTQQITNPPPCELDGKIIGVENNNASVTLLSNVFYYTTGNIYTYLDNLSNTISALNIGNTQYNKVLTYLNKDNINDIIIADNCQETKKIFGTILVVDSGHARIFIVHTIYFDVIVYNPIYSEADSQIIIKTNITSQYANKFIISKHYDILPYMLGYMVGVAEVLEAYGVDKNNNTVNLDFEYEYNTIKLFYDNKSNFKYYGISIKYHNDITVNIIFKVDPEESNTGNNAGG